MQKTALKYIIDNGQVAATEHNYLELQEASHKGYGDSLKAAFIDYCVNAGTTPPPDQCASWELPWLAFAERKIGVLGATAPEPATPEFVACDPDNAEQFLQEAQSRYDVDHATIATLIPSSEYVYAAQRCILRQLLIAVDNQRSRSWLVENLPLDEPDIYVALGVMMNNRMIEVAQYVPPTYRISQQVLNRLHRAREADEETMRQLEAARSKILEAMEREAQHQKREEDESIPAAASPAISNPDPQRVYFPEEPVGDPEPPVCYSNDSDHESFRFDHDGVQYTVHQGGDDVFVSYLEGDIDGDVFAPPSPPAILHTAHLPAEVLLTAADLLRASRLDTDSPNPEDHAKMWNVELRKDERVKTVMVKCSQRALLGTVAEHYPGWSIVRYY